MMTIPQNIISSYEVKFKQIPKIEIINNSFKYAEEEYNLVLIDRIGNKNLLIEKYFLFCLKFKPFKNRMYLCVVSFR